MELSEAERKEFLYDHIPYKLTQLRHHHHYKKTMKVLLEPHGLYRMHEICAIEIGFVSGRVLLEFLGIAFEKKTGQIKERDWSKTQPDDVTIKNFNCNPVDLSDLSDFERKLLSTFYNRANKGSSHFTWEKREIDGFESLDESTIIIERLLREYLYDRLGIPLNEKK